MRPRHFLPLLLAIALAGCLTDDIKETGISRSTAISIAERHCSQYPDTFGYVDRAEWDPDGRFWMVALTDYNGDHGRAYKIGPDGSVIDSHTIDRSAEDDYGPSHAGWWGYYW